jgi:Peptidase family S41
MASDLEELRRLMRRYYPGWAALLALPDFDVEAFFDERIRALRAPGAARVRPGLQLGEVMTTLRAHNPDNHLGAWYEGSRPSDIHEYQAPAPATFTHEVLSSCTFEPPSGVLPETLELVPTLSVANGSLSTLLTVSARADVTALHATCKGIETTLRRRPPPRRDGWGGPAYEWTTVGDAAVLRIRRLTGDARDLDKLEEIARDYPEHAAKGLVVFDLRGNSGGNDGYVKRWVRQARRGRVCPSSAALTPPSARSRCLLWDWVVALQAARGVLDEPESSALRQKAWSSDAEHLRGFRAGLSGGCEEMSAKTPYAGPIVALVDKKSRSSGETSAIVLADALGGLIVGERSGGALEYADLRLFVLPNTGFFVNLPSVRVFFDAPREGVGLPVDLYLDDVSAPVSELVPRLKAWLRGRHLAGVPIGR